jgi:hypothetical protein
VIILAQTISDPPMDWWDMLVLGFFVVVLPQLALAGHVCGGAKRGRFRTQAWVFRVCLLAGLSLIMAALRLWGAAEVRTSHGEILILMIFGNFWLIVTVALFPWFGLSLREDAMERRNPGALVALCGALLGVALTYGGGNVGEGPSYWNNIFSAGLGTGALFGLWVAMELGGRVSVSIAEDRDLASGLRLGAFLLAAGLIFGRAVAGDWHSEWATVRDFVRDGWPGVALLAVAIPIERVARPSLANALPSWKTHGFPPALFHLLVAALWLWNRGRWEGFPK